MKNYVDYIVTGPNGFIAHNLIKSLKQVEPCCSIGVILRSEATLRKELLGLVKEIWHYDGSYVSLQQIPEQINMLRCRGVFHLAALFTPKNETEHIVDLLQSNVVFSTQLLAMLASIPKFEKLGIQQTKFISTSTFSAYDKDGEYNPDNAYSAMKHTVEQIAECVYPNSFFIRLGETYGHGDTRGKIFNILCANRINKTQTTHLHAYPEQPINLTHVEDVCRGLMFVCNLLPDNPEQKVYDFIYPENEITMQELDKLLQTNAVFECKKDIRYYPPQKFRLKHFDLKYDIRETIANWEK
jgi:nucleoside-diphosphate-sugar epimerase